MPPKAAEILTRNRGPTTTRWHRTRTGRTHSPAKTRRKTHAEHCTAGVQPPEETSSLQSGGVQPPDETSSSHHTQTTNTIQQQLPCHAVSTSVTRLVHHANRLEMLFSSQLYGPKSILRNSMGFSPQLKKDISLIHVSSHSRAPLENACFRGPVSARLTSCNAIAMHTPSPSRNGL